MTDQRDIPALPWWHGGEDRRAARAERRRARHDAREARRAEKDQTPLREPVTQDRLADAALRVIDADGLEGLTVRRLASELGLGTMTLYWYVENKDEILDLVADRIMAGVEMPSPGGDWREAVRSVATAVRAAFLRHPQAVPVMLGRGSLGPYGLALIDGSLAVLRAAGFDAQAASDAYYAISNYVLGSCAAQISTLAAPGRPDIPRATYGQMIRQYIEALPADRYGNLKAAAPRMFSGSTDDRFAFGLEVLIDGLAHRLERSS